MMKYLINVSPLRYNHNWPNSRYIDCGSDQLSESYRAKPLGPLLGLDLFSILIKGNNAPQSLAY